MTSERFSARQQLRQMLTGGHSMNQVEAYARRGVISEAACRRFLRLWIVSTATEHPYTARWPLERWSARRWRVRAVIRAFLAKA